nr:hypothetical protein [uncultured Acidovorax sp.]
MLVLVGEGGWKDKIAYIDTHLMPHWWDWALHGSIAPLLAALGWIYLLPPVLRKVATYHEKTLNLNREALFQVIETRTLSTQEALEMRSIMIKQRAEWQEEKANTVQSLENLRKAAEDREATIASLQSQLADANTEIEKLQTPPPRQKFDFHNQTASVKAHHFGIRLSQPADSSELVLFDGQRVLWPWAPSEHQQFEFPVQDVFLAYATEETVFSMLALAQHGIRHGKAVDQWGEVLRQLGVSHPDEQVQTLLLHGFLKRTVQGGPYLYNLHEPGVQFGKWLGQIGFSAPRLSSP